MAYEVLARKWRPRNFSQLVGQEHVQRALINALDQDRVHHAFLFTGTRGVGKTTIARILSKSLNCLAGDGVTSQPCGTCAACTAIDAGRYVDLLEIDAASRTGVDDIRELLDNVQYAPTQGRYKVYLIDEVHMLSNSAFNALLKTLEEPPPHVKFLLATTDPQKLPITILSRCIQFNLKRLTEDLIRQHLAYVLEQEQVQAEAGGIKQIAHGADGSMRDALSLLDQAIAYGAGAVTEAEVQAMLGTVSREHIAALVDGLVAMDTAQLLLVAANIAQQSLDFSNVLESLATALQRIAVVQQVPELATNIDYESWAPYAEQLEAADVQLYYQISLTSRRDLALAPDPRVGFEMAMMRMVAFSQEAPAPGKSSTRRSTNVGRPASEAASKLVTMDREVAPAETQPTVQVSEQQDPIKPVMHEPAVSVVKEEPTDVPESVEPQTVPDSDVPPDIEARFAVGSDAPPWEMSGMNEAEPAQSEPTPDTASASAPAPVNFDADIDWEATIQALGLRGMVKQLAMNCALQSVEGNVLHLHVSADAHHMMSDSLVERLQQSLSEHFGQTLRLSFVEGQDVADTPAQRHKQAQLDRQQRAEDSIARDPNIKALQERFGAAIVQGTVKPLEQQ